MLVWCVTGRVASANFTTLLCRGPSRTTACGRANRSFVRGRVEIRRIVHGKNWTGLRALIQVETVSEKARWSDLFALIQSVAIFSSLQNRRQLSRCISARHARHTRLSATKFECMQCANTCWSKWPGSAAHDWVWTPHSRISSLINARSRLC